MAEYEVSGLLAYTDPQARGQGEGQARSRSFSLRSPATLPGLLSSVQLLQQQVSAVLTELVTREREQQSRGQGEGQREGQAHSHSEEEDSDENESDTEACGDVPPVKRIKKPS